MVSLFNISLLGLLLFFVMIIQAKPLLEASNNTNENKSSSSSSLSNQQLYELYQIIREDPRYASVSNKDIVAYIYRNLVLGKGDDTTVVKAKYPKRPRLRHQNVVQTE